LTAEQSFDDVEAEVASYAGPVLRFAGEDL